MLNIFGVPAAQRFFERRDAKAVSIVSTSASKPPGWPNHDPNTESQAHRI